MDERQVNGREVTEQHVRARIRQDEDGVRAIVDASLGGDGRGPVRTEVVR